MVAIHRIYGAALGLAGPQPLGRGGELCGGVVVELGESVDDLRGRPPLAPGRFAAQPPGVPHLPGEFLAHRGLRFAAPQEESQPGAGVDAVRRRAGDADQLQHLVGLVEEHRPGVEELGQRVRAAPAVTVGSPVSK